MNIEKREAPEKKEKTETNSKPFQLSNSAKITLSVGLVLSLTLASLALVVHSLGNVDLKLRLNRRK